MKKRLLAALLAVLLLAGVLPRTALAAQPGEMTRKTVFHTSDTPDNDIAFTIDGATLRVEGCLRYENMTSIWIKTGDGKVSKTFSAADGQPFSASIDLSGLRGTQELTIYIKTSAESSYWSYLWQNLYLTADGKGGCWIEQNTQALEHDLELEARWVNPGAHVGRTVTEAVQALSDELVGDAADDYEKTWRIYSWVIRNIYYNYDYYYNHSSPVVYAPDDILTAKTSVCAGYANLFGALLDAQGIPNFQVSTYSLGVSTTGHYDVDLSTVRSNHAHNEVFLDGRWVKIDSTWDSRNKYYGGDNYETKEPTGHLYFDISDECLAVNHYILSRPAASEADTPDDWAKEETWAAIGAGLVPYDLQGGYRRDITREEFCRLMVTLLERRTGMTAEDYLAGQGLELSHPFRDTDHPDVLAAYALGIVNGKGSGDYFDPDGSITRQEAAAMLARTARRLGLTAGAGLTFSDTAGLPDWAAEPVAFVSGLTDPTSDKAVMGGTGGGRFSPQDTYTREMACLTALRLFNCR